MKNNTIMNIKKSIKVSGLNNMINDLYEKSSNIILDEFDKLTVSLQDVVEALNIRLGVEEDPDGLLMREALVKYKKFHTKLMKSKKDIADMKNFDYEPLQLDIHNIEKKYATIIRCHLGKSGVSQARSYIKCIVGKFLTEYTTYIHEFVNDNINELVKTHDMVGDGIRYIMNITPEELGNMTTEELDEIIEIHNSNPEIMYIAKAKDLEKMALELGYVFKGQAGSHRKYEHPSTNQCVTIPYHSKDLKTKTSISIQKQLIQYCA